MQEGKKVLFFLSNGKFYGIVNAKSDKDGFAEGKLFFSKRNRIFFQPGKRGFQYP